MTLPTKIMHSTTAGNAPSSLASGQLALNERDRALYYLDPDSAAPRSLLDLLAALDPDENMIINSAMEVDQQFAGGTSAGNGYIIDMVQVHQAGILTLSCGQVTAAPSQFYKSAQVTVSAADASPAVGDYTWFGFPIEGYRIQRLLWGSGAAQQIAIGFWVQAHRPGTYSLSISNAAANRSYTTTFAINNADTFEYKTIWLNGDITGTWNNTNGLGLQIYIYMMCGTTNQTSTLNTWQALGPRAANTQINGVAATTDYMRITGLTVCPGWIPVNSIRAAFLPRAFDSELMLCKRYYETSWPYGSAAGTATLNSPYALIISGVAVASPGILIWPMPWYKVSKRTTPTVTLYSPATANSSGKIYHAGSDVSSTVLDNFPDGFDGVNNTTGGVTWAIGDVLKINWVSDARL
jgi:hypothetical protein